jgi:hypothetical protein
VRKILKSTVAFIAFSIALVGCSAGMTTEEAGQRMLYFFCTGYQLNQDLVDAMLSDDLRGLKTATASGSILSEATYREMSELEKWPDAIWPEVSEYAELELATLDNRSRIAALVADSSSYEQALSSVATAYGDKSLAGNLDRKLQLETSIRVKLGLTLDVAASCKNY